MARKRNLSQVKILTAYRELAKEMAVGQITFQHLAKELEIKSPSLYNHFKNIQEARYALTALLVQELNDELRRGLVGKSGGEAITAYATIYHQFAQENQAVFELFTSIPQTHEEKLLELMHETNLIIHQILASFPLSSEAIIHRSRELRSLIHGYISLRFLGYFTKEPVDAKESYQLMIADFIQSLPKAQGS
ncbi:MAG: TetR/AcrR family transcriptional regulator [Enterococcus sp.]